MSTVWVLNPTYDTERVVTDEGTSRENFPSASVVVPTEVPVAKTLTPAIVEPSDLSLTTPEIVRCARAEVQTKHRSKRIIGFIVIGLVGVISAFSIDFGRVFAYFANRGRRRFRLEAPDLLGF